MPLNVTEVLELVMIGFVAGSVGGLLGLGGGIVIIPALTLILDVDHHLTQAAAMIVNVFVALFSFLRHWRENAVRWPVVWRIVPAGIAAIVVGVAVSDHVPGPTLRRIFGGFLVLVVAHSIARLYRSFVGRTPRTAPAERVGWSHCSTVGASTGFAAGLLGIGGGVIAVPLLRRVCRLPLRTCIATSSAAICLTTLVGAIQKNLGIAGLTGGSGVAPGLDVTDSLLLALCVTPTAIVGAVVGAGLTHRLPLNAVRIAFIAIMSIAAWQMIG